MSIEHLLGKIHNCDCLEFMKQLPDKCVDLVVTSPPYDNLRTYNGFVFDFRNTAKQLYRISKDGGVVVWIVADATINGSETGTSFKQALFFKECGFNIHDTMIWNKPNAVPLNHNRYDPCFEYMFVFSKGKPKTFNAITQECKFKGQIRKRNLNIKSAFDDKSSTRLREEETVVKGTKYKKNIWDFVVGVEKEEETGNHTAIFPSQLANDHILSWSSPGDIVYDPFMGSGTTAKMALRNNRQFIGTEISNKYCEIANKRIEAERAQLKLFTVKEEEL